MGSETRAASMQ